MLTTLRAACVVLIIGCGRGGEPATKPPIVNPPDATRATMPSQPIITAKVTATKPGRPPLLHLTLEVSIDNPTDAARWVIIPKQVPPDDGEGGGVDGLDVRGAGTAVIGTFLGTGAFHAVRVAAGAKAKLVNLPVGWWQASPSDAMPPLGVTVAENLKIGAGPASAWFGIDPLLGDGATVDAGGESREAHRTDGAEVAVEILGGTASSVVLGP